MSDSRSWAADHENEIVLCKYGEKRRYFDPCWCNGCENDRKKNTEIHHLASRIDYRIIDELQKMNLTLEELNNVEFEIKILIK